MLGNLAVGATAMIGQSKAMEVISDNIANLSTNGYKASEVQFKSILGEKVANESQTSGMIPIQRQSVSRAGLISSTGNDLDIAISGRGMFVLKGKTNGVSNTYYGRDGSLHTQIGKNGNTELVDKGNRNLQGYMYDDLSHSFKPTLSSITFDESKPIPATPSTVSTVTATLPALSQIGSKTPVGHDPAGTSVKMSVAGVNSAGQNQILHMDFTHTGQGEWTLDYDGPMGSDGKASTITQKVNFDDKGNLISPKTIDLGWGVKTNLQIQQNGASFVPGTPDINGHKPGYINKINFDENGVLYASFNNGNVLPLAKIPVARFVNANGLSAENGNVYTQTNTSGSPLISTVEDTNGTTKIVPDSVELSNTDLGTSFSNMIKTQQAYSAASKIITTYDSMEQTTRELVR